MTDITILAPTGTLGAGFGADALKRGMSLKPHAIAVDAGSTDPGPYHLGSGVPLYTNRALRKQITAVLEASRAAKIPFVIGSAGGAGVRSQVEGTAEMIRDIARELGLKFKMATIFADIPKDRIKAALARGEVKDFEAGFELDAAGVDASTGIVAQMGDEPIRAALDQGADVVVAGRACDDSAIAAYAIWKGADEALSIHMGKILECGAFSAEPFAMDVMVGTVTPDSFILEPGSDQRRASLKSVAAHSLYEREDPYKQQGPGRMIDLSNCQFKQLDQRRVSVSGAKMKRTDDYWVKLEGAKPVGYRTVCMAGVRCPTMIPHLKDILERQRQDAIASFAPQKVSIVFRLYGMDAVMKGLEPNKQLPHEVGVLIEVTAASQETAHDCCNYVSGHLLHASYAGQVNTSGNLAFPYSPRNQGIGIAYEFSAYHLMKVKDAFEMFPVHVENV